MQNERSIKHDRVVTYLDAHNLDAVLLARRCNFCWYTGGAHNYVSNTCDVGNTWLLVDRNAPKIIANNIEATRLSEEEPTLEGFEFVEYPYHDPTAQRDAFCDAIGSQNVAADAPAPIDAKKLESDFDTLRWELTAWEVEKYRRLYSDTVSAVESVAQNVHPGYSEMFLAGQLSAELFSRHCTPHLVLVAVDERIDKHRHPLPTSKTLRQRAMLVVGAERDGLIASCSRLVSIGAIDAELKRKHQAVITVDAALMTATRPGVTLGDAFAEAQQAYSQTGYPKQWRLHHQGGLAGYQSREVKASIGNETPIRAAQALAWNPSISGTKSEDTVLCTEQGVQMLHEPTDWPLIEATWKDHTYHRPAILEL